MGTLLETLLRYHNYCIKASAMAASYFDNNFFIKHNGNTHEVSKHRV